MPKTQFSEGDQSQGIKGTKVTAAWLNAMQSHRHDGIDQDGSCPLDYAAAAGAVNAYTLALPLPLPAHVPGLPIMFKANNTNTGAATIAISTLAAVAIVLADGSPLNYGNIRKDGVYTLIYNGASYLLLNPSERVGLLRMDYVLAAGYLKRNGALISRATYADLFGWADSNGLIVSEAAWAANGHGMFGAGDGATTFRLPDFRGEFERGADDGRGIDVDRALGSWQPATSILTGGLNSLTNGGWTREFVDVTNPDGSTVVAGNRTIINATQTNMEAFNYADKTVRPRSIALFACIKA